jgi:hypothetical protein
VAVPELTPVTVPVDPMVATVVVLLLQVPYGVASVNVVVNPAHTTAVPFTVPGVTLTVMVAVAVHAPFA